MLRAQKFGVDPQRIVHETIDDETIIIDLETGSYYSLRGSAPAIWALVLDGRSEIEIVGEMQRRHPDDAEAASDATIGLIGELLREGLVAYAEHDQPAEPPTQHIARQNGAFAEPLFEKYTDMEYFLLLDPIHEVEEGGWPRASAADAPPAPLG